MLTEKLTQENVGKIVNTMLTEKLTQENLGKIVKFDSPLHGIKALDFFSLMSSNRIGVTLYTNFLYFFKLKLHN